MPGGLSMPECPTRPLYNSRRTLEAAVARKGITERTLVKSVETLIDKGCIPKDCGGVLQHVRKVGNHGGGRRLGEASLRFSGLRSRPTRPAGSCRTGGLNQRRRAS